jgi:HSP20 family protein
MSEQKKREKKEEARSLTPWRPIGELEPWPSLFGEWPFSSRFPRFMDEFLREWPGAGRARAFLPAMDVSDDDDHYAITIELPGIRKEDVHLELQEGMLTIHGEKMTEREEKKQRSRYAERSYGSFSRSFRLPSDADTEHLDTSFKEGVLTITVPKTEEAKPRTIAIK